MDLLDVRMINLYYGTSYRPEDLDGWAESDVREAIALARTVSGKAE